VATYQWQHCLTQAAYPYRRFMAVASQPFHASTDACPYHIKPRGLLLPHSSSASRAMMTLTSAMCLLATCEPVLTSGGSGHARRVTSGSWDGWYRLLRRSYRLPFSPPMVGGRGRLVRLWRMGATSQAPGCCLSYVSCAC